MVWEDVGITHVLVRRQAVAKYQVVVGVDYPPNKRAEAGDIVDDLPTSAVKWLKEQGLITAVDGKGKVVEEAPVEEATVEASVEEGE